MAYLRDGDVDGRVIDPVCGMPASPGTPHTAVDGDDVVQFCSLACLVRWRSGRRGRTPRCSAAALPDGLTDRHRIMAAPSTPAYSSSPLSLDKPTTPARDLRSKRC